MADDEQRGAKDAGASAPETDAKGGGDNPQEAASERVIIARKWEGAPSVADPKGEKGGPVAVYWYDGERERRGAWPREATRELHFHAVRADTVDGEATLGLALAASAWHGDQEGIADLLHQRGANATWADANGATPMHQAAARGDLGGTKILLDRGGDVNAADEHAMTPLHVACLNGHGAVAELLLTHGANVRLRERSGLTPFDLVPKRGNSALGYDKRAASIDVESLKAVTRSGAQPAADAKPAERPAAKQRKGAKA